MQRIRFRYIRRSRGCRERPEGAERKEVRGKQIRVDYAQARQREIDEKIGKSVPSAAGIKQKQDRADQNAENQPPKLIVRNLPWSIKTSDDLALLFRSYGKVKWATLPKRNNTLAGFGFVIIRGKKNAEKAVRESERKRDRWPSIGC